MKNIILIGDVFEKLKEIPDKHVNTVVTSPPYWGLRSYLPDAVQLKKDVPEEILKELDRIGVKPLDLIGVK